MAFKESSLVRHTNMPAWGVGRILKIDAELIWIDFSGSGLKKLKFDIAAQHLVAADGEEAESRPISSVRSRSRSDSRCAHCDELLKRSQLRDDGAMKSCPKCSAFEGEHVFYPYPEAFGATAGSARADNPGRDQSDCRACRSNASPPHSGGTYCSKTADPPGA
jgi:phage FluMu protein Com